MKSGDSVASKAGRLSRELDSMSAPGNDSSDAQTEIVTASGSLEAIQKRHEGTKMDRYSELLVRRR